MTCGQCNQKPLVRGIKAIICTRCGRNTSTYANGAEVCGVCSDKHNVCSICGIKFIKDDAQIGDQELIDKLRYEGVGGVG